MPPLPNALRLFSKRWCVTIALGLLALILAHWMALFYRIQPTVSLWFPPSGVAVAYTLWFGPVGVILTGITSILMAPLWGIHGWARIAAFTDATEPLVAWWLYRHFWQASGAPKTLRDVAAFTASAPLAACATSAVAGSLAQVAAGILPLSALAAIVPHWWLGNAIGTLAIAPTALFLLSRFKTAPFPHLPIWASPLPPSPSQKGEILAIAILSICSAALTVSKTYDPGFAFQQFSFLSFVPILWAAIRFGVMGGTLTSTFCVLVTLFAYILAYPNAISLPNFPVQPEVLHVHKLSLLVQCLVGLFVGTTIEERAESLVALASERVRAAESQGRASLAEQLIQLNNSLAETNSRLEQSNREKDELLLSEKVARTEAEAARKQVSQILESITDGFLAFDRTWQFTYLNHEGARTLGRTAQELLGKNLWEEFPELEETSFGKLYRRAVAEGVALEQEDYYPPFQAWFLARAYPSEAGLSLYFRNISKRKGVEMRLALQYAIARVLAEAATLEQAFPQVLQSLCESLGWQMGIIWRADRLANVLRWANSWHAASVNVEEFEQANQQIAFAPGVGLPGRIWAIAKPVWISDIVCDDNFPRGDRAINSGLRAVFGFPILLGNEILGVIECFSDKIQQPDEDLLQLIATIGSQIGQFMERKRAEEALRESDERFRVALRGSSIIAFSQDAELRHTWIYNPHPDFSASRVLGKTDMQLLPSEAAERITAFKRAAIESGTSSRCEIDMEISGEIMTYDVAVEPLRDARGAVVGLTGTATDITWRKQMQRSHRETQELFENFMKYCPGCAYIKDEAGRYVYFNPRVEQLFAQKLSDLIGKTDFEILPQKVAEPLRENDLAVLATDEGVEILEMVPHNDGEHYYMSFKFPIKDGTGRKLVGGMSFDISDRLRLENALKDSEERFRQLAENIGALFFITEGSTETSAGRLLYASPAYEKIWGRSRDSLYQSPRSWLEAVYPDDLDKVQAALPGMARAEFDVQFRIVRPDGQIRWVHSRAFPVYNEQGKLYRAAGIVEDITERKLAEEARQQAEERLRVAIGNSPVTVFNQDLELRYTWLYNPAFSRPIEEVLGKRDSELMSKEDAEIVSRIARRVLETGVRAREEVKIAMQGRDWYFDLTVEPLRDAAGAVVGVTGAAVDVSDRKRAEEALRFLADTSSLLASSLDYEATLARVTQIPVPSVADWCSVDILAEDGSIRRLPLSHADPSKADVARKLQQYPPDPNGSNPIAKVIMTGQAALFPKNSDEIFVASAKDAEHLRLLREMGLKSAAIVPLVARQRILGSITFVTAESGRHYCLGDLAIAEEFARRAALAIDNARVHREVQEANRIKDEFLAVLSHELRSPLNPILGWVKLLRTRKFDDLTTARALETIERNAKLQTQLVEDLLDVSRILRGKLKLNVSAVNLASTIDAAIETVRLAAEAKSIQIDKIIDSDIGQVRGDSGRLQQVVWNLLSNAIKFTPSGGTVEVKLSVLREQGAKTLARGEESLISNAQCPTPCAQISVSDTGIGISAEFLPYVFEHFRQADASITRKHGGLGLGLAIARYLVELHGGTIGARSAGVGQGATFIVSLPLAEGNWKKATGKRQLEESNFSALSGLQILIVDDDTDTREFISFALKQHGAQPTAVASAFEVLELLDKFKPDVLVSDIGMPEEDGYSLIRKVRALPPENGGDIPAVALTAYAREEDSQQALSAGFQIHLSKPVDPAALVEAIASLVKN